MRANWLGQNRQQGGLVMVAHSTCGPLNLQSAPTSKKIKVFTPNPRHIPKSSAG